MTVFIKTVYFGNFMVKVKDKLKKLNNLKGILD